MTALAQTSWITARHLRFFVRQPWFVVMALIQPVIWLLLFGALFRSVTEIPGFTTAASYLDYLVPGVLVMTALFGCGWSGMSIIEDLDRSIMDRFLVTPDPSQRDHRRAHRPTSSWRSASRPRSSAGWPWLLGAHFEGGLLGYGALTLCAGLIGASVAAFSDAMALMLRQRESVIGINTLMTLPLTFLSAAFMPLALAPDWIADRGPVQPRQLGGRGRPGGAPREPRLDVHRAPDRRPGGAHAALDGLGDPDVPDVPAVDLR